MFEYICLTFLILFLIVVSNKIFKNNFNSTICKKIEKFESYIYVLEYFMSKSYDIIYKDRILIYSLEGIKIDDADFAAISRDFSYLVLKLMGNNLKNEFVELYGDEETLLFNFLEYFNNKFENDEIREVSKENIINSDIANVDIFTTEESNYVNFK